MSRVGYVRLFSNAFHILRLCLTSGVSLNPTTMENMKKNEFQCGRNDLFFAVYLRRSLKSINRPPEENIGTIIHMLYKKYYSLRRPFYHVDLFIYSHLKRVTNKLES